MDEITKTQRATRAYWFIDGVAELVGGAIIAVVGVLLYASTLAGNETLSTLALMTMIVGFPASAYAVRGVKDRVTHNRTGYVKLSPPSGTRRRVAVMVAAVFGAALGVFAASTGNLTYEGLLGTIMLVVLGVVVTGVMGWRAYSLELPRFYITAAVVAIASIGALVAGLGFIAGMGVMWIALGVTSILTGSTVFAEYMTKPPASAAGVDAS